ncbi:ATP-binding protein [Streptomyces angustmyceticus]|uniref:ATP-binding protein n=1 Tax=Streptomyces angustmyceticus TaxID=285578 RepID=UPI0038170E3A
METSQQLPHAIRPPVPVPVPSAAGDGRCGREGDAARIERDPRFVAHASRRLVHRPEAVGHARRVARSVLHAWRIDDDAAHCVLLVVSELVTNAVEHARPPLALHLRREHRGPRVWVGITDGGPSAQGGAWTSSCAHDERGRGLTIVEALAAAHGADSHAGGTTHWARLPVAYRAR